MSTASFRRAVPALRLDDARLLFAGLAAMLLSLGLPWRNSGLDSGFGWAWNPGYCSISWDGYSYCTTWDLVPDVQYSATGPVPGFQLPVRILVIGAVLILLTAWRRRSPVLVRVGLLVAAFAPLLGGVTVTSGRMLFLLAGVAVGIALHRSGLLRVALTRGPVRT
ncbi:hypothetical protein GIS00_14755 [Nakamurella sp. YIM 132087]|uniref:Uncharacterized protein n=1 Tax=Nakamurella alba TaxID=2665158 RepID=A0A7K1FM23_9ACTN|nr:hypothetical protein [Nakamurella alba]MTD15201.1 hypothetical protein [Nakamurella alba]